MKRLFSFFATLTLLAPVCTFASSGALVKASGPAVYYKTTDGKRYVFPNEATYKTWYADFSGVTTITDAELSALPIAGNVTMKPGVTLVKITTDPKVYAVDTGGVLRWVQTEALASQLYGTSWATLVKDIPDAFFINYKVGGSIDHASAFKPEDVRNRILSIEDEKLTNVFIAPAPAPTPASTPVPTPAPASTPSTSPSYSVSLTSDKESLRLNESYSFQATATPRAGVSLIKLYVGTDLVRTCESSPCTTETRVPASNAQNQYILKAEVSWIDGHFMTTSKTLAVKQESAYVNLFVETPEVKQNGTRVVTVEIDPAFIAYTIDIMMDGGVAKGCNSVQRCSWSETETSPLGTQHIFSAVARDRNGFSAQSGTSSVAVVMNDHPVLTIRGGKSTIFVGETVDINGSATDSDGIAFIRLYANNVLLKTCQASICSVDTGPWMTEGTVTLSAEATDLQGLVSARKETTVNVIAR